MSLVYHFFGTQCTLGLFSTWMGDCLQASKPSRDGLPVLL